MGSTKISEILAFLGLKGLVVGDDLIRVRLSPLWVQLGG